MAELHVLNGVCTGTVFFLPEVPTVVGRSPESHLQIGDPWISSMHAMFERRGDDIWVVDLDSRNGTFVGDERVGEARITPGDLVRFGRTEVRFEQHQRDQRPERNLPEGGAVVRYLDDLKAELDEARGPAPRRDTIRSEPEPRPKVRRELAVLEEVGRTLVDADGLDAALGRILSVVARAVRAERASLLLTDDDGELVARAVEPPGSPPALSSTVIEAAAQSRAGILTLDAQLDKRFSGSKSVITQGIRSAMCVPIWEEQRILGMLLFDRSAGEPFAPEDLEVAALVGNQAALTVERARYTEQQRADEARRRVVEGQLPPEAVRRVRELASEERDPFTFARRDGVVLRTSLSGAASLATHAPAEAPSRIREALDAIADAARAHGGAAVRVAGGALVVFGIPDPLPDAASRAVRAARAMRAAVRAVAPELDLRAGIAAGEVAAGNIAGAEGFELAVLGHAAEGAERLLAAAGPGEILAGAGVAGGAPDQGLAPAGERTLGGVRFEVFRAVGA